MKPRVATAILTAVIGVGIAGCTQSEPTLAPVPQELPDRPALNSVPDDAHYVQTSTGMGGFNYPLEEGQPFYVVDLDADRVIAEGVASDKGELKYQNGDVIVNGRTLYDANEPVSRRVGLFVKRELVQDPD